MSELDRFHKWSVLFDDSEGMTHPVRFSYAEPVSKERVNEAADRYLKANSDWLRSIQDIYPTTNQPTTP